MAAMVQGAVVINEISSYTSSDEIELFNSGPNDVSLDGWTLTDVQGNEVTLDGRTITSGSLLVVSMRNFLGRDGDAVVLNDPEQAVDNLFYGNAGGEPQPGEGQTLARVHNGNAQWIVTDEPTLGSANNRRPTTEDVTKNINEDIEGGYHFELDDFPLNDADGDTLVDIVIYTLPAAGSLQFNAVNVAVDQVVEAGDITNGLLVFTPTLNENSAEDNVYASFEFDVSDGLGSSGRARFRFKVLPVNDAPRVIDYQRIAGRQITGEPSTFAFVVEDVDSPAASLSIDQDESIINGIRLREWVAVEGVLVEGLSITIETFIAGDYEVKIVVTDGQDSGEGNFVITFAPALQIVRDSVRVQVRGETFTLNDSITASPGDEGVISFDYINNLDNFILGNVEIAAGPIAVIDEDAFVQFWQNNVWADFYETEDWAILPRQATRHEIRFKVLPGQTDSFTLGVNVNDEDARQQDFEDNLEIPFVLRREARDIVVQDISLADPNLTCTRLTDVQYNFVNTGENDVEPELYLFNGPARLNADGDFDRVPEFGRHELRNVPPGFSTNGAFSDINFGSLTPGQHTLYAYIVSPFFWDAERGFDTHETQIPVTVGSCLNTSALEEEFTFAKNGREAKSVDLFAKTEPDAEGNQHYRFISEDFSAELNYEGTLEFSIPEGENTQNIQLIDSCTIQQSTITCAAPNRDEVGQSPVTIRVREAAALGEAVSDLLESFLARVRSGMEISNLQINGQSEAQLRENGLTIRPAQDMVLSFRVQNTLDERLTNVAAIVRDNDIEDGVDFGFEPLTVGHLNAGETSPTKTMTLPIPADVPAGDYNLQLEVNARTLGDAEHRDTVPFTIHVQPAASEIMLSAELRLPEEAASTITCAATIPVHVEYTNTGSVDENDVVIQVKEHGEVVWSSHDEEGEQFLAIPRGGAMREMNIDLPVRGAGRHVFSVELVYNFAGEVAGSSAAPVSVTVTKNGCLDQITMTDATGILVQIEDGDTVVVGPGSEQEFEISLVELNGDEDLIQWFVAEEGEDFPEEAEETGATFTYRTVDAGTFNIKVVYNEDAQDSAQWTMFVTEVPISVTGTLETNIPDDAEVGVLEEFPHFVAENSHGEIAFSQPVNLRGILSLEDYIFIGPGIVSVVGAEENEDRFGAATITIKNVQPGKTVIYKYDDFTFDGDVSELDERRVCTSAEGCQLVSHNGGDFVFTVTGFSTYQVVTERESALDVTPVEIALENVDRDTTITTDFRLKNSGTLDAVTGLRYDLSAFTAKYAAALVNAPASLDHQQEATVTLRLTVPANEDAGLHRVGTIKISSDQVAEKLVPVSLNTKTFLKIDSVKVNGKASGDLVLDDINKIQVEVKNELTQDMEDVTVTVEILDVDGDDLEEESDSFDISDNDNEKVTLEFDLRNEEVDEDEFEVKITAEGDAKDGSSHKVVEARKVKVKREKHKVVIDSTSLASETLECMPQTTLSVTVENIGKSDEDNVAIKVRNAALKIDLSKDNIVLEKFDDNDNTQREVFTLNVPDASAGTYPVTVELYRDGNIVDTKEVTLTIKGCAVTRTQDVSQRTLSSDEEMARQLQQQLENQLRAQQQVDQARTTTVTTSFRETNTYMMLLGLLVLLVFIALALGLAVMVKKK